MKSLVSSLAILVLLFACAQPPPERADLLLVGGKVFTADAAYPWAEAIAIRGERILAVGTTDEIEALGKPGAQRIELEGRLAIPGINDAHRHFQALAPGIHQLSLTPLEPSWPETRDAIRSAASELPPGTPIFGLVGVNVVTDPGIDRAILDRLAPDHPVMLAAFYGHGLILNSPALKAAGIADDEPDPAGGFFERDPESGRINGRIFEYAQWRPTRSMAGAIPDEEIVRQLRGQGAEMLRLGITSFLDMPMIPLAKYIRGLEDAELPLRVRVVRFPMTSVHGRNLAEDRDVEVPEAVRDRLLISGVKWILEGTPLERGVALRQPYSDRPDWSGRLNFPPEEISAMLQESLEADEPLLLHVSGDRTIEILFDAMEAIRGVDWPSKRVRLEHGDGLTGDLIERAVRLGVIVVQNPTHFALGEAVHSRLGPDRGFFRMRSLIDAGIPVAIGSDGPPNPWLDVMMAVIHPADPAEALSVGQAIEAYTRGAAFAEFQEHEKGTLAPGMLADIAVLSQDVFSVPPDAIPATESVLTLIGGHVVHDAGVLH